MMFVSAANYVYQVEKSSYMLGSNDALAVCQAHRGLPVGFLLLRYTVLFIVGSLSLLYLLLIS